MPTLVGYLRRWKGLADEHCHAEPPFVVAKDLGSPDHHLDPIIIFAEAW